MQDNETYVEQDDRDVVSPEDMDEFMNDPMGVSAPASDEEEEDGGEGSGDDPNEETMESQEAENTVSDESDGTGVTTEGDVREAKEEVVTEELPEKETTDVSPREEGGVEKPDEERKFVFGEFSYVLKKVRELESTINTVSLSIGESADTVDRVNRSMRRILESMGKVGDEIDSKVSQFQDGTETWGAEMNRVADNVRKACDESRGFLNDDLKREMKKAQEDILRATLDRVKGETSSILMKSRDDYDEILNQVVMNYKQFCKAAAQHQKDLKKGYFLEVRQLRRLLYSVLAAQAVLFLLVVVLYMYR